MERGHKDVTVFVPAWRKEQSRPDALITGELTAGSCLSPLRVTPVQVPPGTRVFSVFLSTSSVWLQHSLGYKIKVVFEFEDSLLCYLNTHLCCINQVFSLMSERLTLDVLNSTWPGWYRPVIPAPWRSLIQVIYQDLVSELKGCRPWAPSSTQTEKRFSEYANSEETPSRFLCTNRRTLSNAECARTPLCSRATSY